MDSDAGSPVEESEDDRSSFPFTTHVSRVLSRFDELLPFALVPLVLTLLESENAGQTVDARGSTVSVNLELSFPAVLIDLWSFVDPPESPSPEPAPGSATAPGPASPESGSSGAGGTDFTFETPTENITLPLESALDTGFLVGVGLLLILYAALSSVIAAGYLGGIDRRLRGEPVAIRACLLEYTPRFFAYHLLVFGAFLALVPVVITAPATLLLVFPLIIVLGYLFYAAPFLFVVDDAGFLEAFRRSYGYAVDFGPYVSFAFAYVVVAAVASVVLSLVVSVGGIVALTVALALATPLSLVLTAATVSFLHALVASEYDDETTAGRELDSSSGDDFST